MYYFLYILTGRAPFQFPKHELPACEPSQLLVGKPVLMEVYTWRYLEVVLGGSETPHP